jgi:hypothetical protein
MIDHIGISVGSIARATAAKSRLVNSHEIDERRRVECLDTDVPLVSERPSRIV